MTGVPVTIINNAVSIIITIHAVQGPGIEVSGRIRVYGGVIGAAELPPGPVPGVVGVVVPVIGVTSVHIVVRVIVVAVVGGITGRANFNPRVHVVRRISGQNNTDVIVVGAGAPFKPVEVPVSINLVVPCSIIADVLVSIRVVFVEGVVRF